MPHKSGAKLTGWAISVKLGDVYKQGNIRIENADLSKLPSLPPGILAMPNMAYRISTDAVAVGPYTSGAKQVFVNGRIQVRILKPKAEDSLTGGSDLQLTAVATRTGLTR